MMTPCSGRTGSGAAVDYEALERSKGVRSKAAQHLGLNRTTLLEKMKKMKIEREKS